MQNRVDYPLIAKKIEDFIYSRLEKSGAKGVVIGLSGGVDSAVVAALSAKALGPAKVLGLLMPAPTNAFADIEDARLIASRLGIATKVISLKSILESFSANIASDQKAMGNLTARLRMCLLYYEANRLNFLVAGTGNKSELSVGYFTKYGDGGCDLLPIGDILKTQVWELAKFLGIPSRIINRVPTAGLWPGQTDEGELGISYKELDDVLLDKRENLRVRKMINMTEHKRKPPEACKI